MKASGASSPSRKSDAPSSSGPSAVDRFRLSGPTERLDHRINAVRRDVADVALAKHVIAPHYARALPRGCSVPRVTMRAAPDRDAPAVSELLHGETFALLDASGDWGWGYTVHDNYVGYVPCAALERAEEASHVVVAPATLCFATPDIKSRVAMRLPMGARVAGEPEDGFLRTAGGFVPLIHLSAVDTVSRDPVAVAERLIGVPYRWGGRSGDGIDCSGLVQLALHLCGAAAPRDSDQQRALGEAATGDGRRGDLVFLPGHVGMLVDADTLLHANAHWMAVVREPLADVLARAGGDDAIVARRRLPW